MADIRFPCPECESPLVVDEKGAGMFVACPFCGKQIKIPSLPKVPIAAPVNAFQPPPRSLRPEFSNVGNLETVCPHCNRQLEKRPGKKRPCPHCGQFIFVRTRPSDEQQVLVTEAQTDQIAEQWSIVHGTHAEFLADKKRFADERAKLNQRFGREPTDSDVRWSQLNQKLIEHAKQGDWGLYRNAKQEMGEILRKESKHMDALGYYLDVCYLDLNGPNNTNGCTDRSLLRQYPPWNPKGRDAELAMGIVDKATTIIDKIKISKVIVEELFMKRATALHDSLRLPLQPATAWSKICDALSENE